MKILCLIILLINNKICQGANILAIAPIPGKSHYYMLGRIFKELAARGHEVDVVSHFPLEKPIPRYNDLSVRGTLPILSNNLSVEHISSIKLFEHVNLLIKYTGPSVCEAILSSKTARNLRDSTKKYDLLIFHYMGSNCMLGFAHVFNIPTVAIITGVNLPWTSSLIGLPDNPSYIPNHFAPYVPNMTLIERIVNTLFYISSKIKFDILSSKPSNIIAKRFFGPELPSLEDLAKNISLVMVNSHFSTHQSRPVVPNFVEVAGVHIDKNITLPKYFEESLKTDTKGIIYLSFGSMLLTESFPEGKLRAFFEAFRQLPYKVMWKGTKEKFPKHIDIPNNIQFEPWMPQLGILCHPNVKLFISHGGMFGTLEALYCGVPILGIPMFSDQTLNIRNYVSKGMAIEVPYDHISEETIKSAIKLLLNDPTYKTNAERRSKLFKDRQNSALDTAIYWVEYVIRYNGAPQLRSMAADLPWYKYYLIDVIGVFIFVVVAVIFSLYKSFIFVTVLVLSKKLKKE